VAGVHTSELLSLCAQVRQVNAVSVATAAGLRSQLPVFPARFFCISGPSHGPYGLVSFELNISALFNRRADDTCSELVGRWLGVYERGDKPWEFGVIGHCPDSDELASKIATSIRTWDRDYRLHLSTH